MRRSVTFHADRSGDFETSVTVSDGRVYIEWLDRHVDIPADADELLELVELIQAAVNEIRRGANAKR